MERRKFLNLGLLATMAGTIAVPEIIYGSTADEKHKSIGSAKNIIFMVSDGMSNGTLTMADLLMQRKLGYGSKWLQLYRENKIKHALMDTASADSLVTDSAAGCSAWGGGVRVKNGSLNINADGTSNKPILQKFKDAGKSVGCVTTVPITHATPAGFAINTKNRGSQEEIANLYLSHRFDVMMGGGSEYFSKEKRKDGRDLFAEFASQGFSVATNKTELLNSQTNKPLLGVFYEDGLPYTLDQKSTHTLLETIPTLAEMTLKAIQQLSKNPNGFVMQVEGGKVDWGAHANDIGALLYDQIAFDEAVAVAIDFAETHNDTLVVITTDHGNANPGLIKSRNVDTNFDRIQQFKYTNEWILNKISKNDTPSKVIELINEAQGYAITANEASEILTHYEDLSNDGIYNAYKLPFRKLAEIQQLYTSVGWSGMDHSGDFVELAMFGPGSDLLNPMVKNFELHNLMLQAAGVNVGR